MNDLVLEVVCPRCGHEWSQDLEETEVEEPEYDGYALRTLFRVTCPECSGVWLMPSPVAEEREEEE